MVVVVVVVVLLLLQASRLVRRPCPQLRAHHDVAHHKFLSLHTQNLRVCLLG